MELLQLKYFQILAEYQHMAHAAEALNIAQPTLSKSISRLEFDLGVKLFDRRGRNIQLNECGATFLQHVNNIFYQLDEGMQELNAISQIQQRNISLALNIPSILPSFKRIALNIRLNIHSELGLPMI